MTRRVVLALEPRGLDRVKAAAYVGVGPTKFDEMVADGRMPKPARVDGRVLWDRHQLDAAFDDIFDQGNREQWQFVA
jgi:predicted DNA-binding transcriptional regulator AlpA